MEKLNTGTMTAVCRTRGFGVELKDVPVPEAEPGHLVIKVMASAINPGDKAWIAGSLPGTPESLYDVCGVSGAGRVLEIGEGVHPKYKGKRVAFYRSLKFGDSIVGTWCGYARMYCFRWNWANASVELV